MTSPGTRVEHLDWCKARAIEYVERGDLVGALASFTSDVGKHPETAGIAEPPLSLLLATEGARCVVADDRAGMRRLIEGYS